MEQISIIRAAGSPVRYAYLEGENLKFKFEYFETRECEGDYEIVHTVIPQEFKSIPELFGLDPDLDILSILQQISDAGRGEELKDALNSKAIKNELWTWRS